MNQNMGEDYTLPEKQNKIAELLFLYTLSLPEGSNLNNRMSLDQRYMRMGVLWQADKSQQWLQQSEQVVEKGRETRTRCQSDGDVRSPPSTHHLCYHDFCCILAYRDHRYHGSHVYCFFVPLKSVFSPPWRIACPC